jgi:hypothetical protein
MAAEVHHRRRQRPEPVEQVERSRGRPHLQLERIAVVARDLLQATEALPPRQPS